MADFMGAKPMPLYGGNLVRVPNIEALARDGVVFETAYSNSPICVPSRASMMTGKLPSKMGVFDNGAELPSSVPTIAHYLRARGYATCLSGKMHFIGADQLHGFEERITSNVVPADYGWMPVSKDNEPAWKDAALEEWPNMKPVIAAGTCIRSLGMDFDDEVAFQAVRKIHDYARDPDEKPFFLTASFVEPHEPYATTLYFGTASITMRSRRRQCRSFPTMIRMPTAVACMTFPKSAMRTSPTITSAMHGTPIAA